MNDSNYNSLSHARMWTRRQWLQASVGTSALAALSMPAHASIVCPFQMAYQVHLPPSSPPTALVVLVPGASYDSWVWDVAGYSWVHALTHDHGLAVVTVDCLGYGASDHPHGDFATPYAQASALNRVLRHLRNRFPDLNFVVCGHSFGGLLAYLSAELADALAIIGFGHAVAKPEDLQLLQYARQGPYFSLPAELRVGLFYNLAVAAPEIVTLDAARGQPIPRATLLSSLQPARHRLAALDLPIFLAKGSEDNMLRDYTLEQEASLLPNAALTLHEVMSSGHTVMLHPQSVELCNTIATWVKDWLGCGDTSTCTTP